ncbi:hypothetical protein AAMO2058_000898100 [Amorphochlora amoebiformis]
MDLEEKALKLDKRALKAISRLTNGALENDYVWKTDVLSASVDHTQLDYVICFFSCPASNLCGSEVKGAKGQNYKDSLLSGGLSKPEFMRLSVQLFMVLFKVTKRKGEETKGFPHHPLEARLLRGLLKAEWARETQSTNGVLICFKAFQKVVLRLVMVAGEDCDNQKIEKICNASLRHLVKNSVSSSQSPVSSGKSKPSKKTKHGKRASWILRLFKKGKTKSEDKKDPNVPKLDPVENKQGQQKPTAANFDTGNNDDHSHQTEAPSVGYRIHWQKNHAMINSATNVKRTYVDKPRKNGFNPRRRSSLDPQLLRGSQYIRKQGNSVDFNDRELISREVSDEIRRKLGIFDLDMEDTDSEASVDPETISSNHPKPNPITSIPNVHGVDPGDRELGREREREQGRERGPNRELVRARSGKLFERVAPSSTERKLFHRAKSLGYHDPRSTFTPSTKAKRNTGRVYSQTPRAQAKARKNGLKRRPSDINGHSIDVYS